MSGEFDSSPPPNGTGCTSGFPAPDCCATCPGGWWSTPSLHVGHDSDELVLKAAPAGDRHLTREISAHPRFTASLTSTGHAA